MTYSVFCSELSHGWDFTSPTQALVEAHKLFETGEYTYVWVQDSDEEVVKEYGVNTVINHQTLPCD